MVDQAKSINPLPTVKNKQTTKTIKNNCPRENRKTSDCINKELHLGRPSLYMPESLLLQQR
jgi:hypothetical protein